MDSRSLEHAPNVYTLALEGRRFSPQGLREGEYNHWVAVDELEFSSPIN